MLSKLMTNLATMVKLKIKQRNYIKAAEEEKSLELANAIHEARESMQMLRDTLIRLYECDYEYRNNIIDN